MAIVTIIYTEDDDNTGTREMTLTREKEDMTARDMLYFFADAMRAAGYDQVNRVGYATHRGAEVWGEF